MGNGKGNSADRDRRKYEVMKKRDQALKLRWRRYTYQQIGDQLYNGDRSRAWKEVQKGIDALPMESAEAVRKQELELLDRAARGIMKQVENGNLRAIQTLIHIMERRTKYLGLDSPTQIEASGTGFRIVLDPDLLPDGVTLPENDD